MPQYLWKMDSYEITAFLKNHKMSRFTLQEAGPTNNFCTWIHITTNQSTQFHQIKNDVKLFNHQDNAVLKNCTISD